MKCFKLVCIVLVFCCASAQEEARGSLFHKEHDSHLLLANINSQLAALQTQVTANANSLSATNGQISNLNTQIGLAITAANAAANATAATTARVNNLINVLSTNENSILAAFVAAPLAAGVVTAQTNLVTALNALSAPGTG